MWQRRKLALLAALLFAAIGMGCARDPIAPPDPTDLAAIPDLSASDPGDLRRLLPDLAFDFALPAHPTCPWFSAPFLIAQQQVGYGWVAAGDFDRDGWPDIAATLTTKGMGVIALGQGKGAFAPWRFQDVNTLPKQIAVADVTGDGLLDIVTAGFVEMTLLRGRGDGTFHWEGLGSGDYTDGVALADFNRDGRLDIATLQGKVFQRTIATLLADKSGGFRSAVYSEAAEVVSTLVSGNLDGDSDPDVVTLLFPPPYKDLQIVLYHGRGDGQFTRAATLGVDMNIDDLAVADLNRDGKLDVLYSSLGENHVGHIGVALGHGDGTFTPFRKFQGDKEPLSLAVSDIDGDGMLDVVAGQQYARSVAIFRGDGAGNLKPPVTCVVGSRTSDVGVADPVAIYDLNRDGKPDILALTDYAIAVMLSR